MGSCPDTDIYHNFFRNFGVASVGIIQDDLFTVKSF